MYALLVKTSTSIYFIKFVHLHLFVICIYREEGSTENALLTHLEIPSFL